MGANQAETTPERPRKEPRASARHDVAPRFQPFLERAGQRRGQPATAARIAIKRRRPLHERPLAVYDRRDANGRLIIGDRQRRCAAKFVGLRPFDIRLGQEPLADVYTAKMHASDRADGIAGLAVLDLAKTLT